MLVIGLAGEIGAGKSTLAEHLQQRGALVIDADKVGHEILELPGIQKEIVEQFGEQVRKENGGIDRRSLGHIVFADPQARRQLERIMHPRMKQEFSQQIETARSENKTPLVVLDAAILFEAGWDHLCDHTVFLTAPRETRQARLSASRGWTPDELEKRERSQASSESKRRLADAVIENAGSPADCFERMNPLLERWSQSGTGATVLNVSELTRN